MDFRSLQYFLVVARELNITKAAEKLHMSQPPLSTQMKNLEEDLGVKLFIRGRRQLTLTDEGRLLLRRAEEILQLADKTREDLSSMENALSGTISIGMVEGQAPYLVARWVKGFREEYPLVRYDLWNGSGDDVIERLSQGLVDVGVIARPYDREHLRGIPVAGEPWVAIMSSNNALAKLPGNSIPLKALVGQPLIVPSRRSRRESIVQWFAGIGAEPTVLAESSNYINAMAMAENDAGISIFPQTTKTENPLTVSKIITDPMKVVQYVIVTEKEKRPTALVREFINYVQDMMQEEKTEAIRSGEDTFLDYPESDLL